MSRFARNALPHAVLVVFSLMILMPLLWILRVSFTDKLTAYKIPPEIGTVGLMNYVDIFARYPFAMWFGNSLLVALLATAISLPLATLLAYAFARFNTGGTALRLGVLGSQMLPPIVLVLPLFGMFLVSGLMQSRAALVIAHLTIALPFLAWMMVSFFEGDVARLEEAARVDGASRWQAFRYIAVPVAAPGILAAGLLGFILSWNEFLFALVLTGPTTQTLPVGLAGLETHAGVEIAPLAAATVVSLLPVFLLLPFLRKHLIKGLSLGALK
ncbi:MAG TPA: carbohydrate ABC transporter permease [Aestuariivirgaceae bacterium]|nr:carbohydrate ABC transporter permease [Aestuariivirgaceae bacterium]